jgi:hypothetical protein
MIVREEPDGSLIMIGQTDHAKVSGQFAAHWGNDRFERPRPFASVVRAAAYHDSGWYGYETSPTLMEDTGKTRNFMQVPWGPVQRRGFQWAIDWMTEIDTYSGLLLSRHRTGLQRGRYGVMKHPTFYNTVNIPDDNIDFLAGNEKKQEELLANYDANEFATNYALFQTWDLLSLELCNKDVVNNYIEPVPTAYDNSASAPVKLAFVSLEARTVEVSPYPFNMRPLNIHLVRRRLPISKFSDQESFQQMYFQAPIETVSFKLI